MTQFVVDDLTAQLEQFRGNNYAVLQALQTTQEMIGFVPDSALDVVAKVCNVSRAEVYADAACVSTRSAFREDRVVELKPSAAQQHRSFRSGRTVSFGIASLA